MMLLNKLKVVVAIVPVLGLIVTGASVPYRAVAQSGTSPVTVQRETPPVASDLDAFQGEWGLEEMETDGKKVVDDQGRSLGLPSGMTAKFVCKSKNWGPVFQEQESYAIEIDSIASPKKININFPIDVKFDRGGKKEITYRKAEGIYKIEGDKVSWCFNVEKGGKRPTTFKTAEGSGLCIMAFKKFVNAPDDARKDATRPQCTPF